MVEKLQDGIKPKSCLFILTGDKDGVDSAAFFRAYFIVSSEMKVQLATPHGGNVSFIDPDSYYERHTQNQTWMSISFDEINLEQYDSLLIPSQKNALLDLTENEKLGQILSLALSDKYKMPLCAIGFGVFVFLSLGAINKTAQIKEENNTSDDEVSDFQLVGRSITGPSMVECLNQNNGHTILPLEVAMLSKGVKFTNSTEITQPFIIIDGHLITAQNMASTSLACKTLIALMNEKIK